MEPSDTSTAPPQQRPARGHRANPISPPLPSQDRRERHPRRIDADEFDESHLIRGYD